MSHIDADRVLELSTSTGDGNITLSGAVAGYESLAQAKPGIADGDTVDLYIEDVFPATGVPTGAWECGTYTWRTGGALERTAIRGSSNAGAPVAWGEGMRRVGVGLLSYMVQAIRALPQTYADAHEQARVELAADVQASVNTVANDLTLVQGLATQVSSDAGAAAASRAAADRDATATAGDRAQTGQDRTATGADRAQTGLDKAATAADRTQTGLDKAATAADRVQTGQDKAATAADRIQTGQDKAGTAGDRAQTGLDKAATAADRVQTGQDRTATGADRVQTGQDRNQTGLDKAATAADRIQTGNDKAATSGDRAQTGQDRTAVATDRAVVEASAAQVAIDRQAADADRNQTGIDRAQTGADRIQTGNDVSAANAAAAIAALNAGNAQALYGGLAAVNGAVNQAQGSANQAQTFQLTAVAQAALAATYAASAASVAQQDLSGATAAALHRSPNAITAAILYDVSRDSDPTWPDRMYDRSWMKEPLNGNWLGAQRTELDARCFGATLGPEQGSVAWSSASAGFTVNGASVAANAVAANGSIRLPGVLTAGKVYRITFTCSSLSAGGFKVLIEGGASVVGDLSGTGTFTGVAVASVTGAVYLWANSTLTGAFTNFSVKEVTAFNTRSGDYYQLTSDGKFYRLFTNVMANSDVPNNDGRVIADTFNGHSLYTQTAAASTTAYNTNAASLGNSPLFPVTSGLQYVVSFDCKPGTYSGNLTVSMTDGVGTAVSSQVVVTPPAGGSRVSVTLTASSTANALFRITGVTQGGTILIGALQVAFAFDPNANTYESKGAISLSVAETFRGNKAKFPKLVAIVAEMGGLGSLTHTAFYDLTEPGRPMWMSFYGTSGGWFNTTALGPSASNAQSLAAREAVIAIGIAGNDGGVVLVDFAKDTITKRHASPNYGGRYSQGIAGRNSTSGFYNSGYPHGLPPLVASTVNAVAMTTLPTAPVDPVTSLQTPTIAVGTAGGVSVIRDDGTIANDTSSPVGSLVCINVGFTSDGRLVRDFNNDGRRIGIYNQPSKVPTASFSSVLNYDLYGDAIAISALPQLPVQTAAFVPMANAMLATRGGNGIDLLRPNLSNRGAGLVASITSSCSSGIMAGDARRVLAASVDVGNADGASGNVVGNGSFDTDLSGWVATSQSGGAASIAWQAPGMMRVTGAVGNDRGERNIPLVAGQAYELFVTVTLGTAPTARFSVIRGQAGSYSTIGGNFNITSSGTYRVAVVAPATETGLVQCAVGGAGYADFDNIILRPIASSVVDRSAKASLNTRIVGSLTLTPVATAAQLAALGGFSNDPTFGADLAAANYQPVAGYTNTLSGVSATGFTSTANTGGQADTRVYLDLTTVAGRTYQVTFASATGVMMTCFARNGTQGSGAILSQATGAVGTLTLTAMSTQTTLLFAASPAQAFTVSGVSIKPITAIGSAASVAQEPWSADLDVGTGAWRGSGHFNVPATRFGAANLVPNSAMAGGVAGTIGSGGAFPTGWTYQANGLSIDLSYPVVNGAPLAQVRVYGIPADSNGIRIRPIAAGNIPALNGQQFAGQFQGAVTAGAITNTARPSFLVDTALSSGAYNNTINLVGSGGFTLGSTPVAHSGSITLNDANVSRLLNVYWFMPTTAGAAIDITLQLGAFQLERGTNAGTYIPTTGTPYNGISPIFYRGGPSGAYYTLGVDGNGMLAAEVFDTVTTRRATSSVPANNGTWNKAVAEYDGAGTLSLKMSAQAVGSAAGAALLTLNSATAPITYGNNFALTAAFPGQIALVHVGATTMIPAAESWAYDLEREMFLAGVQVTLPDPGGVLGIAYDDRMGLLKVITAMNEASFTGLVRISSAPVSAGSFVSPCDHKTSVKLVARSGSNQGVDVTMLAQNLKEELLRREESAARALRAAPRTFDFDATANQTDFPLPVGWEAIELIAARSSQREGATKDWTRKFNGFYETPSMATPQAASTWVQIIARRAA